MNLKEKIEKILKEKEVDYTFIPLPEDLAPDVPSHAAFHGIKMANAMTTILYKTEKGIIGIVKSADRQVDEKKLKDAAGVTRLVFASKSDLQSLDVAVGMVPYLGLEIPYYVDAAVLTVGKIYGTAAEKTTGMAMNASDLLKVNHGVAGSFTFAESTTRTVTGKRIVSGITPSGDGTLHIGNYLGAVKQFIEIAKSNECFLFVADMHGLTTIQDRKRLSGNIEALVINELALLMGFLTKEEFERIIFYRQSDIAMHGELQSILNNVTPLGLLRRAHAYKDKLQKEVAEDDINLGLFNYPILMAADILMYHPHFVPVGRDQKQHVEITRDIAERFNKTFKKNVFTLPEPMIPEDVGAVLGTDGKRKMSKSLGNIIAIFESEDVIRKQVMGSYTDPTRKHATDPGHIEGNMVFTYLDFFGDPQKVSELKKLYKQGATGDVEVKEYLFESILTYFGPARKRYEELKRNPKQVQDILNRGRGKALAVASETMREVRDAVGLVTPYSGLRKGALGKEDSAAISIDEFARIEVRVGKVREARNKEGSDKLIRLVVDVGEETPRIIFTGVRGFGYVPEDFTGRQFLFITNLQPRKMLDEESQGMILAVDGADKRPQFVNAEHMPVGAKIR